MIFFRQIACKNRKRTDQESNFVEYQIDSLSETWSPTPSKIFSVGEVFIKPLQSCLRKTNTVFELM